MTTALAASREHVVHIVVVALSFGSRMANAPAGSVRDADVGGYIHLATARTEVRSYILDL
jgi:hypothetical protein